MEHKWTSVGVYLTIGKTKQHLRFLGQSMYVRDHRFMCFTLHVCIKSTLSLVYNCHADTWSETDPTSLWICFPKPFLTTFRNPPDNSYARTATKTVLLLWSSYVVVRRDGWLRAHGESNTKRQFFFLVFFVVDCCIKFNESTLWCIVKSGEFGGRNHGTSCLKGDKFCFSFPASHWRNLRENIPSNLCGHLWPTERYEERVANFFHLDLKMTIVIEY